MSSFTRTHAKNDVELYGEALRDRMVISDIESEEVRGNMEYRFRIQGEAPREYRCTGVKELATVLSAVWDTHVLTRERFC